PWPSSPPPLRWLERCDRASGGTRFSPSWRSTKSTSGSERGPRKVNLKKGELEGARSVHVRGLRPELPGRVALEKSGVVRVRDDRRTPPPAWQHGTLARYETARETR